MSIWLLILFALCMVSGVFAADAHAGSSHLAELPFVTSLLAFLAGLVRRGIRRPVV